MEKYTFIRKISKESEVALCLDTIARMKGDLVKFKVKTQWKPLNDHTHNGKRYIRADFSVVNAEDCLFNTTLGLPMHKKFAQKEFDKRKASVGAPVAETFIFDQVYKPIANMGIV